MQASENKDDFWGKYANIEETVKLNGYVIHQYVVSHTSAHVVITITITFIYNHLIITYNLIYIIYIILYKKYYIRVLRGIILIYILLIWCDLACSVLVSIALSDFAGFKYWSNADLVWLASFWYDLAQFGT
jgi:hypothetical protein